MKLRKTITKWKRRKWNKKCDRVDYIVAAHSRVVDRHNFHVIWSIYKSEQLSMMDRLGWLNTFDPVTPERRHYLNLEVREERVITMMLVRLAMVEPRKLAT